MIRAWTQYAGSVPADRHMQCLTHRSERNDFTVSDLKPLAWFTTLSFSFSLPLFLPLSLPLRFALHRIASHRSDRFWQRHSETRVSNKLLLVDKSGAILLWDYDVCTESLQRTRVHRAMLVIRTLRVPLSPSPRPLRPAIFLSRTNLVSFCDTRGFMRSRELSAFCNCIDRLRDIARRSERWSAPTRADPR